MGTGSRKPGRRKAAGAALRYEHRPGRPREEQHKERGNCLFACLVIPVFLLLIAPLILIQESWGEDIWGDFAPSWPGGAYAFAATVGACVPLAFAAFVAPLTRMDWKAARLRSLAWALGSLPGLGAGYLIAGVISATWRPRHRRDWYYGCYSRGGPCWVHVEYPYLWAVGLLATLATTALIIAALVMYVRATRATPPSTSEP
jgi:hypothetical protein